MQRQVVHRQTNLTVRVRLREVMKFTRSMIPYIYCNLSDRWKSLINHTQNIAISNTPSWRRHVFACTFKQLSTRCRYCTFYAFADSVKLFLWFEIYGEIWRRQHCTPLWGRLVGIIAGSLGAWRVARKRVFQVFLHTAGWNISKHVFLSALLLFRTTNPLFENIGK